MSVCASCGTRSEASSRFCSACGKPLGIEVPKVAEATAVVVPDIPLAEHDGKIASIESTEIQRQVGSVRIGKCKSCGVEVQGGVKYCGQCARSLLSRYRRPKTKQHPVEPSTGIRAKAALLVRATCSEGRHYACGAKDCGCDCHTTKLVEPKPWVARHSIVTLLFAVGLALWVIGVIFDTPDSKQTSAPSHNDAGANKLNSVEGRAAAALSVAMQINSKPSEHLSTTLATSVESPIPTLLFSESDRDPHSLPAGGAAVLSEAVMNKLFSQPDLIRFLRQCGFRRVVVDFQGVVRGRDIPQED